MLCSDSFTILTTWNYFYAFQSNSYKPVPSRCTPSMAEHNKQRFIAQGYRILTGIISYSVTNNLKKLLESHHVKPALGKPRLSHPVCSVCNDHGQELTRFHALTKEQNVSLTLINVSWVNRFSVLSPVERNECPWWWHKVYKWWLEIRSEKY